MNYFDHEKLEVYQVELAFLTWLTPLLTQGESLGRDFAHRRSPGPT